MLHDEQADCDPRMILEDARIDSRESVRVLTALIGCIVVAEGGMDAPREDPSPEVEALP